MMGDSKIAESPATQDYIRRAAKARRRNNAKKKMKFETFTEGLISDRASHMSSMLELTMVSSSPSTERVLKAAHAAYVTEFTLVRDVSSDWQRHKRALDAGMKQVCRETVNLQNYCKARLTQAFNASH